MATAKYWQSNKPPSALLSLGCLFFFCGLLFCVSCNTTTANEWVHSEEGRSKRCVECADNGRFLNRSSLSNEQVDLSNPVANLSDAKTPIDWDEVEANFNRVLSEDEVFHKWDTMEANMKSGIRNLLRTIFPKIIALSSDAKVSGNCSAGILKWIVSLRHMKAWALKMLDAIGKPPSGIFEGVVTMFGNYDQCLKLRVFHDDEEGGEVTFGQDDEQKEFFRGQYCVAEFKPWLSKKPRFYGMNTVLSKSPFQEEDSAFNEFTKMAVFFHFISFRIDLCVPSTCSKDDIQRVANLMANLAEFRARVLRCEKDKGESRWTLNFMAISAVILLLVSVSCFSTLHDLAIIGSSFWRIKYFTIFSLRNSWKHLCTLSNPEKANLNSLYGARVILLLWIIAVHTFVVVDFEFFREMQTLKSWASKWPSQIITNSLFQFDCLILISAFIFGYSNIGSSSRQVFKYLIKRYIRILVLVLAMIFVTLSLPFFISRGPLTQDFIAKQIQSCQVNGWRNVLFGQNFSHTECLPGTWIFCVELQLMFLTSPLLIIFRQTSERSLTRKLFWFALPLLLLAGFLYNFMQVYINRLPPMYYWTLPDKEQRNEYFDEYFHLPWTHLSVFTIGFYSGIYRKLHNSAQKSAVSDDQGGTYLGYFFSILIILTFTFGFHDWITGELPNEYVSAMYNSSQNVCLSLAYSWILFSITDNSQHNLNSLLTRLLSTKMFLLLGKLTLAGYLALPLVQTLFLSSQQQHLYSSTILMVYVMLGNVVFTFSFALVTFLLVEIPAIQIASSSIDYLFGKTTEERKSPELKSNRIESSLHQLPDSSFQSGIELSICK